MEREKLISLVTAAQQGDPQALNDLFNAFYNDVYYFALKTLKDDQIAEDITQETFVEIINTLGDLNEPAAFVKWMKQITYHQCTRYFKKKKDVIVDEEEDGSTVFDTLQEEKAEFIPDEALDQLEFKKTIMAMLDELSEAQRAAVMMFYFDELSIKQIAQIQGVSENTVKSRLNYARKGIQKSVEDYEKKNGVKLHCVGVLPLLFWLFKDYFAQSAPASAAAVAEGVSAATGTTVTVATGTTTAAAVTTATTAAAAGVVAKATSIPLVTKLIAGIVAATVAIGGGTAAVLLSNRDSAVSNDDTSIVSSEALSSTATTEDAQLSLESKFRSLPSNIHDLGFFTSVDQLSAYGVFSWAMEHIMPTGETKDFDNYVFTYTYSVSDLDALSNRYLGRTWDYSSVAGSDSYSGAEYAYDAGTNTVTVTYRGAFGDAPPEVTYTGYTAIDDTHYEVAYSKCYLGNTPMDVVIQVELTGDKILIISQQAKANTDGDTEAASLYYDLFRVTASDLTVDEIAARALANAEHVGGEAYGDPVTAIYAADYAASCFADMDIFGYGITVDEMCGLDWGNVDFFAYLVGDDMDVLLNSAGFSLSLPVETKDALLVATKRDVSQFAKLLNGEGDPYVSVGSNYQRGLENIPDEAYGNAADGTGNYAIQIFTSDRFTINERKFGLSMSVSSSEENGIYYYDLSFHITFDNP